VYRVVFDDGRVDYEGILYATARARFVMLEIFGAHGALYCNEIVLRRV